MFGLWLAARLAFTLAGVTGLLPAALLNLAFMAALVWRIAKPVWRDPGRPHLAFLHALAALAALQTGYFFAAWRNEPVMPWLLAAAGVLMILIVVAMSRISMRLVNAALDARGAEAA